MSRYMRFIFVGKNRKTNKCSNSNKNKALLGLQQKRQSDVSAVELNSNISIPQGLMCVTHCPPPRCLNCQLILYFEFRHFFIFNAQQNTTKLIIMFT